MSIKDDALIVAGIALAVLAIAWYAKKKIGDAGSAIAEAASEAWEAAAVATTDTIFGPGQTINSTIPLYDKNNQVQYTPGDINDGAIF